MHCFAGSQFPTPHTTPHSIWSAVFSEWRSRMWCSFLLYSPHSMVNALWWIFQFLKTSFYQPHFSMQGIPRMENMYSLHIQSEKYEFKWIFLKSASISFILITPLSFGIPSVEEIFVWIIVLRGFLVFYFAFFFRDGPVGGRWVVKLERGEVCFKFVFICCVQSCFALHSDFCESVWVWASNKKH